MALGYLLMTDEEFDDTTLRRLYLRLDGFFERENEREKAEFERTRWLATVFVNIHARKGRSVKPKDLVVFPWEANGAARPEGKKLTIEEQEERFRKADERKLKAWGKNAG